MAVELENGYTRIANEILEALAKMPLNGTQWRMLLVVFRYTYGFSRKEHDFSLSFLSAATGIHKQTIKRELDSLIAMNILTVIRDAGFSTSRVIQFNKNYETWEGKPKRLQSTNILTVTKTGDSQSAKTLTPTVSQNAYQERKNKKNIYTADFEKFYSEYPRPEDKRRTFNNWKTCLKDYSIDDLMKACNNYKAIKNGTEKQYLKTSANFLGRDKPFEDYIKYIPSLNNVASIPKSDFTADELAFIEGMKG